MSKRVLILLVATVLTNVALAQGPAGPPPGGPADKGTSDSIGPGGTIVAELAKSVDAKKAKPDDKIEARLTMDLLSHGKVEIPRGAKIIGHITDAKTGVKQAPGSMVEIAFDRIVLKGGREIPLKATIQALGAPLQISGTSSDGIPDASAESPNLNGNMPDGMGNPGRNGTTGYPSRPASTLGGLGGPADNGQNKNSTPPLGPTSQGVVGMKGISLSNTAQGSAISSATENIHLGGGTQLVLRVLEP